MIHAKHIFFTVFLLDFLVIFCLFLLVQNSGYGNKIINISGIERTWQSIWCNREV